MSTPLSNQISNVKMSVDNAILFCTLITILISLNIGNTLGECVSGTKCSCVMSNGEGYDLSKITGPKDEFIESALVSGKIFYFHPCGDKILNNKQVNNVSINTAGCNTLPGVTLCMYQSATNTSTSLGVLKDSNFVLKSANVPQIVIGGEKHSPVTIDLVCNPSADEPTIFLEETPKSSEQNYKLMLVSPHACKVPMHVEGLSTGSVLVIIFFVISGIYFAGGALALKLLRGATGWEMLPNQKFWFDLPVLVRDGIAFTFNGCKVVSYDQI